MPEPYGRKLKETRRVQTARCHPRRLQHIFQQFINYTHASDNQLHQTYLLHWVLKTQARGCWDETGENSGHGNALITWLPKSWKLDIPRLSACFSREHNRVAGSGGQHIYLSTVVSASLKPAVLRYGITVVFCCFIELVLLKAVVLVQLSSLSISWWDQIVSDILDG